MPRSTTDLPALQAAVEQMTPGPSDRMLAELDRLLTDAHGVPDDERERWAKRLAKKVRAVRLSASDGATE